MKAKRKYLCVLGFYPDGKHCLVTTERPREALVAECEECEDAFDGEDPIIKLSQYVTAHQERTGHRKFIYYTIDILTEGETALDSAPDKAAASSPV